MTHHPSFYFFEICSVSFFIQIELPNCLECDVVQKWHIFTVEDFAIFEDALADVERELLEDRDVENIQFLSSFWVLERELFSVELCGKRA